MNYKFHFFNAILICAFLIIGNDSYSQELDLNSYIDLVKKNNIDLKQGSNRVRIAKEETKIARALVLPNMSADGSYQRDFSKNFLFINDFDGSITRFRTNFNNTIDFNATVSQTVFDPVAFSAVRIAKLAEELYKLNNESVSDQLVTEASSLYWQAVFIKESIKVLDENSKLAKEQIDQVKKIYDKGLVSDLQLHQTEALYKKTIPVLNNAQNQYKNILNELKALADIPVSEDLIVTDNLETIEFSDYFNKSEINLDNQSEVKAIKKEAEIIDKQIASKKKFWYPKLNLIAGYNYNGQDNNFKFNNNENKLFFGQLRASIPIFSGGSNKAEITKAKIEKETAELHLKNKKKELLKQLEIAGNNYNNAIENITIHRETVLLNEKEIEVFNKQLKLGVVTPIEFKEARLRLTRSRLDLLNDYLDLHVAKLQIKRVLGTEN